MNERLLNMYPHFSHVVERIAAPSWQIREELCSIHNLILIYDGAAEFYCNGQYRKAGRGDLIYYQPGDRRRAHTAPPNLMKCFAVDFLYTCPVWQQAGWELEGPPLPFDFWQTIREPFLLARLLDLFADFTKEWLVGKQNRMNRCRAMFLEIMSLLLMEKDRGGIHYDKIKRVEQVIQYMAEHYTEPITLAMLSRAAQISPSYLGNIFKEVTGKTPVDYLIGIRVKQAKELIRDGFSIAETAFRVGFHDIFYFSKCFKKHEGVAPSKYRS